MCRKYLYMDTRRVITSLKYWLLKILSNVFSMTGVTCLCLVIFSLAITKFYYTLASEQMNMWECIYFKDKWRNFILGGGTFTDNGTKLQTTSLSTGYAAKTGTYTLTATDHTIDCTTGTFTATLPTAVGCTGREYAIKNSGTGVITVATTSSQTIDGSTTYSLSAQ